MSTFWLPKPPAPDPLSAQDALRYRQALLQIFRAPETNPGVTVQELAVIAERALLGPPLIAVVNLVSRDEHEQADDNSYREGDDGPKL